ncbi:MAG: AAA family ATPase, partial [Synergistaceae bacterium]|nr:AAA family ATPase [Synergistaceae bacterium]
GEQIILAEGYATGASIYECISDRYRVIIAFDAPNLPKVTAAIKSKFPNIKIGIAADDDAAKHGDGKNPGVEAAKKSCEAGAEWYIVPLFNAFDKKDKLTDWNDYYRAYGADATREALLKALENPIQPLSVDTQIEAQGDIQTANYSDEEIAQMYAEYAAQSNDTGDFYGDYDNPQPSEAPVKEVAPEADGVLTNELIEKYSTRLSRDIKIKDIEIIGGLFPRGKLSMIASAPGVGKSWATLYLACLLSKGRNIFDFDKIGTPVKTLVFCGEGGEEEPILRFKGTEWDNNSDNVILIDENNLLEENIDLLLTHEAGQRNVKRFIEYHRPAVVFIDSLIAFSDKDENSSKEMDGLLKFLTRITKKYDIALVLSHHTRKRKMNERAAEQNLDEIIGTSSFARVIRQVIGLQPLTMEADNGGGDPNVPIVVRNLKSFRKKFKPFTFQLVENEHGKTDIAFDFEPKIKGVNNFDKEAALYNYICETFKEEQEFSKRDLDSLGLAYLGIQSDRTLQRMLNTLEKKGKLKSRGELKGMKYYLPQK